MIHDLFVAGEPLLDKVVRSVLVYLFLVALLRIAGKREFAQLNNGDLVVLLLLSNTVQNAIIGNDFSLWGGLFGAFVLVVANRLLVRLVYDRRWLIRMVEGTPTTLIARGRLHRRNLRHELITNEQIMAAVRRQGASRLADVDLAVVEPNGTLTVELHDRLGEVLERLRRIEQRLPPSGHGGGQA
ncbi:MAG TPA: YetF domain-containing protein [Actinomycetes bacterium]|nr:YetF domain-containing protein [Actinomycetes bacterium]